MFGLALLATLPHARTNDDCSHLARVDMRQNADAYKRLLLTTSFPGIEARSITGYRGIRSDRGDVPDGVECVTTMLVSSMQAIGEFAGPAHMASVVPASGQALSSRYDAQAAHYEIVHLSAAIGP